MFTDNNPRAHEFLPENAFAYLVDGNADFRRRALNAIAQSIRLFIQNAGEGEEAENKTREAVNRFLDLMKARFLENPSPSYRIGGLIGLASAALALDDYLHEHADDFIKIALPYFYDQDATVRYYACESLYNIFKKARKGVVRCFPDIFDSICKICCDVDEDVKQTSQFINRLLRDIILEENPPVGMVIDLIAGRLCITNSCVRLLMISWIMTINSIPSVNVMAYLPKVYIGLFNMLIDSNKDVRGAAELCLAEFLTVFKKTYISKTGIVNEDLFRVILLNNQRNEYPIKKTNIIWVKELAHLQPQVIHFDGFPLFLKTVVMSIADQNADVSTIAQEANKQLFLTAKEDKTVSKVEQITEELTEILENTGNQVVMVTILQWLTLLLELKPRIMNQTVPIVSKAVMTCFKQSDSELILEATLKAMTLVLELGNEHFELISQHLVELFKADEALLEERGNAIIINVCIQVGFEKFYKVTTECLMRDSDEDFLRRIVHALNWTLMTSDDAIQLRQYLLTAEGDALGTQLQKCWEPNLAAALALALWREKYELANELVQRISESNFGLEFWICTDRIVQLLDSHVFMKMRLHLLKPSIYPALLQALLGKSQTAVSHGMQDYQ